MVQSKGKKTKVIYKNTSLTDVNVINNPLFACSIKEEVKSIAYIEDNFDVSPMAQKLLNVVKEAQENVIYRIWLSGNGERKEMIVTGAFPDFNTADTWDGLMGLYINKITPVEFDEAKNEFIVENNILEFSLYELARFMNKSTGQKVLDGLKDDLIKLKAANYYTFKTKVFYDKKNQAYPDYVTEGFSFINRYKLSGKKEKGRKYTEKCMVEFNDLFVNNIRCEYFQYINPKEFFSLPSRGIVRQVYKHLKITFKEKIDTSTYYKRNIYSLADIIPITPRIKSKIKAKLRIALKVLKEVGFISDYFFGDEIIINNVSEDAVYFVFKGTKESLISSLSVNAVQCELALDKDDAFLLYIPDDLEKELIEIGVEKMKAHTILKKHSKWSVLESYLWLREEMSKHKNTEISNPAGLLIYALESGNVNLEDKYKHILDFVAKAKKSSEEANNNLMKNIQKLYDEYIQNEIAKFKDSDSFEYIVLLNNVLDGLNSTLESNIATRKKLILNLKKEDDIKIIQSQLDSMYEFKEKQIESIKFKKDLEKEIRNYLHLKSFEQFREEFYLNSKIEVK